MKWVLGLLVTIICFALAKVTKGVLQDLYFENAPVRD